MKLSDAVTLGSSIVKLKPHSWNFCAIGAAVQAEGMMTASAKEKDIIGAALGYWPWLESNDNAMLEEIANLFDTKVCNGRMTLDQLIEYIAQIEPPCECGVRDCGCHLLAEQDVMLIEEAVHA